MKLTRRQRKWHHRELTLDGFPRKKDGNRLGLRKRLEMRRKHDKGE